MLQSDLDISLLHLASFPTFPEYTISYMLALADFLVLFCPISSVQVALLSPAAGDSLPYYFLLLLFMLLYI